MQRRHSTVICVRDVRVRAINERGSNGLHVAGLAGLEQHLALIVVILCARVCVCVCASVCVRVREIVRVRERGGGGGG